MVDGNVDLQGFIILSPLAVAWAIVITWDMAREWFQNWW